MIFNFPHAPYRRVSFLVLFALAACLAPLNVSATWSIDAVDQRTGEVGSAAATCTGFARQIVGVAPGRGVIVAQANSNHQARRPGVQMLMAGARPEMVIQRVANGEFHSNVRERQYEF